ncbi:PAS domain-containing sensor histidine kinase [Mucilaginibacter paludis]|nr:PAS domain-containing sensor histidine kinase [Mucilaginibacter paludis]
MKDAALFKAVIENVVDGIVVINKNGLIRCVNPSACLLFGYTSDELCGKNVSMLMQAPEGARHAGYVERYELTGQAAIIGKGREVKAVKKGGIVFPARLAVGEASHEDQQVYIGIIHDLSLEKEAEEKLQKYTNKLEAVVEERTGFLKNIVHTLEQAKDEVNISLQKEREVNRLKTRFVSMASHEFRTPLSGIQLSASLIEYYYNRQDKQKVLSHLKKIKVSVGELTAILDDFLSVEKIEAGKLKSCFKEFDIREMCLEVMAEVGTQSKPKQKIRYKHKGDTTTVSLDCTLLRHCLINLLTNAIKYSGEDAFIHIETIINSKMYHLRVRDNGIGIPANDQANLFEAFFRAQNTTGIQGTGLGLNIVKRYADMMNGFVRFESVENQGSVFTISFPIAKKKANYSRVCVCDEDHSSC